MHRNSPTLHTGQSCETEKCVKGPTWPKMKCDFAGEGQQQFTTPDQILHTLTLTVGQHAT